LHLRLESGWLLHFGSLLKGVSYLNQPWFITLESTKARSKRDSLLLDNNGRIAASGENRGGIGVVHHNCVQLELLH
jgi:hypothetical protein